MRGDWDIHLILHIGVDKLGVSQCNQEDKNKQLDHSLLYIVNWVHRHSIDKDS